jgi:hypothetical protein
MENIDWLIHVLKVFKASTMLNEVDFCSKMLSQWYNIPIINFLIFEGWNKLYIFLFLPMMIWSQSNFDEAEKLFNDKSMNRHSLY